jgi:hypothetical protein
MRWKGVAADENQAGLEPGVSVGRRVIGWDLLRTVEVDKRRERVLSWYSEIRANEGDESGRARGAGKVEGVGSDQGEER